MDALFYTSRCVIEIKFSIGNIEFKSIGAAIPKQAIILVDIRYIDFFFRCEFLEVTPHTAGNDNAMFWNLLDISTQIILNLMRMFTDEYFERQLQQIREIRLSERKFYQKVTDLYATAFDYDKNAKTTRLFFQTVQNKMHFAVHRHTAAELIYERADAAKEHMGLTTWENAPDGKIFKADVTVAKNYLSQDEMHYLERIVSLYLDYAELQAERKIPMSMEDWAKRLDGFLEFNGNELLTGPGKISAEQAKLHAETEYEKYRLVQDHLYESDFDRFLMLEENANIRDEK